MSRIGRPPIDPARASKRCPGCEEDKPREAFPRNGANRDGLGSRCKPCRNTALREKYATDEAHREKARAAQREWRAVNPDKQALIQARQKANRVNNPDYNRRAWLRNQYGITVEEYVVMAEVQQGLCAICRRGCPRNSRLSVDHDHDTGRVRGLLCDTCNKVLGMVEDSPERLRAAADYLENLTLAGTRA